jgi:hypothetical protein
VDEKDMPYREIKSNEFLISRAALDEAYSALAGCRGALGDVANISVGMDALKTAAGNMGGNYEGHEPNFEVTDSSDIPGRPEEPKLGLATNSQLEKEIETRKRLGHTHPDYKTVGYDGPLA